MVSSDTGTETLSLSGVIESLKPLLVDKSINTDEDFTLKKLHSNVATQFDTFQPIVVHESASTTANGTGECAPQFDVRCSQLGYTGIVHQMDAPPSPLPRPSIFDYELAESQPSGPRELTMDDYDEDTEFIIISGKDSREKKEGNCLGYRSNDVAFLSMLMKEKSVVPRTEMHAKINNNCDIERDTNFNRKDCAVEKASTLKTALSSNSLLSGSSSTTFGQQQHQRSRSSECLESVHQPRQVADNHHCKKSSSSKSSSLATVHDHSTADVHPQQELHQQHLAASFEVHQGSKNLLPVFLSYGMDKSVDHRSHGDNHNPTKKDSCGSTCLAATGQLLRAAPRDDLSAISDRGVLSF